MAVLVALPIVIIVALTITWNVRWKRRYDATTDPEAQARLRRQRSRFFISSGTSFSKGDKLFRGRDH
jgi:hypothetical protein